MRSGTSAKTLEASGVLYDPFKTDDIFGSPAGFNIVGDSTRDPAMMFGTGQAIPDRDRALNDRPDNKMGVSNRVAPTQPTKSQKMAEVNYVYLGLFAVVLAVALL